MSQLVPQAAPNLRIKRFMPGIEAAVVRTLSSDTYILGPEVVGFERRFADYLGVGHCVGVNSGTDALTIALRALHVPAGAEVLTSSMTASATGAAIVMAGLTPRYVDVERESRCMDLDAIAGAVTPRTAVIVPVHLHGYPMDMPKLMAIAGRFGLRVVEDCAQAHGARVGGRAVGAFGDAAAFSFYPTKNLGGTGDAGAVITNDEQIAERARALRIYGWRRPGFSEEIGYNSRLSEMQAAILSELLPHLDANNRERAAIANVYRERLRGLAVSGAVALPPDGGSVYHQFAIEVDDRDDVRLRLLEAGVGTGVHYGTPLHRQPAFSSFATTGLPVTDLLANRLLSLPIQPEVAAPVAGIVAEQVVNAIARAA